MTTLVARHGIHDSPTLEKVLLWGAGITVVASLAIGSYGAASVGLLALAALVLTWRRAVIVLMAVVMLVPVHLYEFPIPSPFGKPDRAIVVPMLVFFLAAALGTRRVQFRATPMGLPLALFGVVMAAAFVVGGTELALAGRLQRHAEEGALLPRVLRRASSSPRRCCGSRTPAS